MKQGPIHWLSPPAKRTSLYAVLSSMRFAIALVVILAIASIIGTVCKQNAPYAEYVMQFGPFWFQVFAILGLYDVYHSLWFNAILIFLVMSTSLCVFQQARRLLRAQHATGAYRSQAALESMPYSATLVINEDCAPEKYQRLLLDQGYRIRRQTLPDGRVLLRAKKGAIARLGYFAVHIGLIVICLGGLIDGQLLLKIAQLTGQKVPETRAVPLDQAALASRLSAHTLSFRGEMSLGERQSADVLFVNAIDGYFVQPLPFIVTLKRFHVSYYANGMPKLFSSELLLTDKATGKVSQAEVKVNHPLVIDGIAIYQASFADGGSALQLQIWPLVGAGGGMKTALRTTSLSRHTLVYQEGQPYQLELGTFVPINIEDMRPMPPSISWVQRIKAAQTPIKDPLALKNIGPSLRYTVRDAAGQGREYMIYKDPLRLNEVDYRVLGLRRAADQNFQFIYLPLDEERSLSRLMQFRGVLTNATLYPKLARRSAEQALRAGAIMPAMRNIYEQSVLSILKRFADSGFVGIEQILQKDVAVDKRLGMVQTYLSVLQIAAQEALEMAWPATATPQTTRFLLDSLIAISGLQVAKVPLLVQLDAVQPVYATGLQMTRSPGRYLVYLGAVFLLLGTMLMFYIREQRLWLLLGEKSLQVAMNTPRRDAQLAQSFAHIVQLIKGIL